MIFLATSALDDTAFAWAYVLTIPSFYLASLLYVASLAVAIYALIRRYVGFLPLFVSLAVPPILTLCLVQSRNGPGWLYLLTVVALPIFSFALLVYFLTAGTRSRSRSGEKQGKEAGG